MVKHLVQCLNTETRTLCGGLQLPADDLQPALWRLHDCQMLKQWLQDERVSLVCVCVEVCSWLESFWVSDLNVDDVEIFVRARVCCPIKVL